MRIAVTGASGLVGSTLLPLLTTGGHSVTRLVRRSPGDSEVGWDPTSDVFDASALDGVDAVVHLAGENINDGRAGTKVNLCSLTRGKIQNTGCFRSFALDFLDLAAN